MKKINGDNLLRVIIPAALFFVLLGRSTNLNGTFGDGSMKLELTGERILLMAYLAMDVLRYLGKVIIKDKPKKENEWVREDVTES